MIKEYLKEIRRSKARAKYLRTVGKLAPRIAGDIGVPEKDYNCDLISEENWINAAIAGRFSGGWGLSSGWSCLQQR